MSKPHKQKIHFHFKGPEYIYWLMQLSYKKKLQSLPKSSATENI